MTLKFILWRACFGYLSPSKLVAASRPEAEKDGVTIPMTVDDYIVKHQAKPADVSADLTDIFYDTTDDDIAD